MKAVIDTNVLIFDYVENSEFHKEAEELLDYLEGWVIPAIVIHEFIWFLKRENLDSHIDDVKAYIRNEKSEIVGETPEIILDAISILQQRKLSLSHYNDLIILSHAVKNNLPLATFDEGLKSECKRLKVKTLP
ncbi:PIN domain-containing protein [Sulfolobus tengchongensis]|uniref:Ribonuclease VapC n=1 Tax=Sulfolobus tengchongensis TaxID=207809 RepID=A0AAX4L2J8_9CREN